jgi:hypothetical protein
MFLTEWMKCLQCHHWARCESVQSSSVQVHLRHAGYLGGQQLAQGKTFTVQSNLSEVVAMGIKN